MVESTLFHKHYHCRPPDKSALLKIIFLSLKTYVVGTQKIERSFEQPKYTFKLMDKKIIAILRWKMLNWSYIETDPYIRDQI